MLVASGRWQRERETERGRERSASIGVAAAG